MNYKHILHPVPWAERDMWIWPEDDVKLLAVFDSVSDLDLVLPLVKEKRICIQAGGAVGVWPLRLSKEFELVYTYEPHPHNFRCLAFNCLDEGENIIATNAALGEKFGRISLTLMDHETNNHGAFQVSEGSGLTGRIIPITMIDALHLDVCDLIYLDIEGLELFALMGAEETIRKCKPVIAIEDKGLSEAYGHKKGVAEEWLIKNFGYVVVARPHRDVILVSL
jgi:FkbM family methyltransferase